MADKGTFVISLDFELYWGMIDKVTLEKYGANILGVREAIPRILDLFEKYQLHATWATVGMLMYESQSALQNGLPAEGNRPVYASDDISTYAHIANGSVGTNEADDPYHFAPSLVRDIQMRIGQEIGSHTFSHYYCLDAVESVETFRADMNAQERAFRNFDATPQSLVFPRNQTNKALLQIAQSGGITAYRGCEDHYLYHARKEEDQTLLIRALRLLDHYINISGHHTYKLISPPKEIPINLPSSRFLRPYSKALSFLEGLRLRRIKTSMTHAAENGEVFHLWWHPHNFGANIDENIAVLETIAQHYAHLQITHGMKSKNMDEIADELIETCHE